MSVCVCGVCVGGVCVCVVNLGQKAKTDLPFPWPLCVHEDGALLNANSFQLHHDEAEGQMVADKRVL